MGDEGLSLLRLADNALMSFGFDTLLLAPAPYRTTGTAQGRSLRFPTSHHRYRPSLRGSALPPHLKKERDVPSEALLEWNVPAASLHARSRLRFLKVTTRLMRYFSEKRTGAESGFLTAQACHVRSVQGMAVVNVICGLA